MRPENIRHAEASLLLLALASSDGPRRIAEVLDESLLSDAPVAKIIKELLGMALNGEWYSGADLLAHLPPELANDPEAVKLMIREEGELTGEQCTQILQECSAELKREHNKRLRQELLFELNETSDMVRQLEILEKLKELRS